MSSYEIVVRPAQPGDEAEIANVHISSWREAYLNLLPKEYLDHLPLTFRRRMTWWQKAIFDAKEFIAVAADNTCIVGFASFGEGRDQEFANFGEMKAIYLLKKYHQSGIGFQLLNSGLTHLAQKKYRAAYCWVLDDNPTIRFYERTGAKFSGTTKFDEIGGQKVRELAYVWSLENL